MTESVSDAIERRDITLAFTPTQLLLIAIGAFVLVRILRGLRR